MTVQLVPDLAPVAEVLDGDAMLAAAQALERIASTLSPSSETRAAMVRSAAHWRTGARLHGVRDLEVQ